jgi:hypothetical protein
MIIVQLPALRPQGCQTKAMTDLPGDGTDMMGVAFKDQEPPLILADLVTQTGPDIRAGYRSLFMGSQQAIRNPAAYEPFDSIDDDGEFELLSLACHLMPKLDQASHDGQE